MTDSNVVGLHRNEELIERLEVLLKEAKLGQLQSLNAIVQRGGSIDFELDYTSMGELEILGGLEMLKGVILSGLLNPEE